MWNDAIKMSRTLHSYGNACYAGYTSSPEQIRYCGLRSQLQIRSQPQRNIPRCTKQVCRVIVQRRIQEFLIGGVQRTVEFFFWEGGG